MSLQFEPLRTLGNAYLGAFWASLGPDWPDVSDAVVLPQESERFGDDQVWEPLGSLKLKLIQDKHPIRIQARNQAGDRMIQIQNGRLLYNWIKGPSGEYPRYKRLKADFAEIAGGFRRFLSDKNLGDLIANQWEVTYVNHLPKGTVWETPSDWPALFTPIAQLRPDFGFIELESFSGERHYRIPDQRGRLHVQLQHARVGDAPKLEEVIILKLTARGPISAADAMSSEAFDAGLDLGHDVIVRSFQRLTSEAARQYWKENT